MVMQNRVVSAVAVIIFDPLVATRAADGYTLAAAHFGGYNDEVPEAVKAGTAWPIMGDPVRAETARVGAMTINSIDFTSRVIESSDPQIHGMKAAGAKDATYQAAYRSCMRRKGF